MDMTEDFFKPNQEGLSTLSLPSKEPSVKEASAVDSISSSASAIFASSMRLGAEASCAWPTQDSFLQVQRRTSLAVGSDNIMSFPDPRRDSLGLGGDLGIFSGGSRRSSLALGLDFANLGDQGLSSSDVAALASQSLGTQSLFNSGLGPTANAQLQQLSLLQGGDNLSAQHQQLLLQQRQQQQILQQQQAMVDRALEAKRVQAEAQAAAAALFLGAPMPNEDNATAASSLDQLWKPDTFSASAGSQQLLGSGLSLLPTSQTSTTNRDRLNGMGPNLSGAAGGNVSLDSLQPSLTFSQLQTQLQQKQQQQQLQLLQSSHGGSSSQTPQQQLQQQLQQQKQLEQQLQQMRQTQESMRRHSLGLSSFDTSPQPQPQVKPNAVSLSEQLRLHAESLSLVTSGDNLLKCTTTKGGAKREQPAPPQQSNKKPKVGASAKKTSTTGSRSDLQSPSSKSGGAASKKDTSFPLKLHEILSNPEHAEMIAWMPHGKSWRILKPSAFENVVIPLHFRHSKYASFMRQVNGWGFQRVLHGNDHNSYKHDMFVRDQPELCKKMKRVGTVKKIIKEGASGANAGASTQTKASSNSNSKGRPAAETKKALLDSEKVTRLSKLSVINENLTPQAPQRPDGGATRADFDGNDVNSLLAARSALSNKFAASIGNVGGSGDVALNQANNSSFSQLFEDVSSMDVSGNSLELPRQLGSAQIQNLMKLSPSKPPQQQQQQQQLHQSLSSFANSREELDTLIQDSLYQQQLLAIGADNRGGGSSISGGLTGGGSSALSATLGAPRQGDDSDPFFSSSQFQMALASSPAATSPPNIDIQNVEEI